MKLARLSSVPLVTLLVLVATLSRANEDSRTNPYESIAARNPFQLKDPPPAPDPNDVPKPPPPPLATVELTGVVNLLSKKKALLEIVPGPGKPAEKKTLEEGDRVDMVEVLSIDVDEGLVKIKNGDVITNIALKVSKPPAGVVAGVPGQPGFPPPVLQPGTGAGIVPPTVNPAAAAANPNASPYDRGNVMVVGGAPAAAATPSSSGVIPKQNYGAGGTPANSGVNITGGSDLRSIPSRPIRTQTAPTDAGHNDPARQYLDMAVQRQQRESRGLPTPPLPPIPGLTDQ